MSDNGPELPVTQSPWLFEPECHVRRCICQNSRLDQCVFMNSPPGMVGFLEWMSTAPSLYTWPGWGHGPSP